ACAAWGGRPGRRRGGGRGEGARGRRRRWGCWPRRSCWPARGGSAFARRRGKRWPPCSARRASALPWARWRESSPRGPLPARPWLRSCRSWTGSPCFSTAFAPSGTWPEEEAPGRAGHGDEARPHGVPAGEPPGVLSGTGSGDAAESAAGGESGQGPARSGTSPTRLIGYAPPDPGELAAALARVDFRGLEIDAENSRARLARPGQAIDLGAIAKGYGADRAVQLLKEHGVVRALVDLGGDVYALGTRPDGTPWRLGIRHPRRAG